MSGATGTDRTEVSVWNPEDQPGPHVRSLAHQLDVWLWFWDHSGIRPIEEEPGWAGTWPEVPLELELGPLSTRVFGGTRRPRVSPADADRTGARSY